MLKRGQDRVGRGPQGNKRQFWQEPATLGFRNFKSVPYCSSQSISSQSIMPSNDALIVVERPPGNRVVKHPGSKFDHSLDFYRLRIITVILKALEEHFEISLLPSESVCYISCLLCVLFLLLQVPVCVVRNCLQLRYPASNARRKTSRH